MSSRAGPRATGTDGRDFMHRERVATHYTASATNKWRLKLVIMLHFLMVLLMATRLSTSLFVLAGIRPPGFLQRLRLPKAQVWEFVWLSSFLPAVFGLAAMKRNKVIVMHQYVVGTLIFGLLPVLYAIYELSDDIMDYWDTRQTSLSFMGFPLVVLWSMFLTIALQIHAFGLLFAWQLIKAWKPKKKVS